MFNVIDRPRIKRSKFNLTHDVKFSAKLGALIPIMVDEIVPGDKFRVRSEVMMRFAPMIAPVLHSMDVYTHYFFVPNRLLFDSWESFITGGEQGSDATLPPRVTISDTRKSYLASKTLADYMGLPIIDQATTVHQSIPVSLLPFRAYQTIYNEYYRDQNLEEKVPISKSDGNVTNATELDATFELRYRKWAKDYFTSALPWTQRGEDVSIPTTVEYSNPSKVNLLAGDPAANGNLSVNAGNVYADGSSQPAIIDNIESLGITINDLRESNRLQQWLERSARGGSRYIEQILSHFGVMSSDKRLQRPEYLGGGKNPVVISEVLNTAGVNAESNLPQGNMAGHGISVGVNNGFRKRFEEHGWVIGLLSVMPKAAYSQGIHRKFTRNDKFDYYWPEFANLGEQKVLNQEIFMDWENQESGQRSIAFGYQSRYAEYKYGCNRIAGDFRTTLNYWHLARQFQNQPVLNNAFVEYDKDNRIFAVEDENEDHLYCQVLNRVDAVRPMPYFATPRL